MHRRTRRLIYFSLAILAGLACGVIFGWVIYPVQYTQTSPQTLRIDYKTDVVLMIAELYHAEGDIALGLARLAYLGEVSPVDMMDEAIAYAEGNNYALDDVQFMRELASAVALLLPVSP